MSVCKILFPYFVSILVQDYKNKKKRSNIKIYSDKLTCTWKLPCSFHIKFVPQSSVHHFPHPKCFQIVAIWLLLTGENCANTTVFHYKRKPQMSVSKILFYFRRILSRFLYRTINTKNDIEYKNKFWKVEFGAYFHKKPVPIIVCGQWIFNYLEIK